MIAELGAWGVAGSRAARAPSGNIAETWFVDAAGGRRLVVQKMHPIFGAAVLDDMEAVTAHLAARGLVTQRLVRTLDGALFTTGADGRLWRALTYLDGHTVDRVTGAAMARSAAGMVARFHRALEDLDHSYRFVRAGVHDTAAHLGRLEAALGGDGDGDGDGPRGLAETILTAARAIDLGAFAALPRWRTHGDLKISNVLFDGAEHAVALIDLDTMGFLPLPFELGDAWRSWCNPLGEDVEEARFDLEIFAAAVAGYGAMGAAEAALVVAGVETIALELAARFCVDAFEDRYFGWDPRRFPSRREHNRVRAAGQLSLARAIAAARGEAEAIVRRPTRHDGDVAAALVGGVLAVLGLATLAGGVWLTLRHVHDAINTYDEGILLTDAMLLAKGQTPYRDFYTNYPPGIFQLIQGLFAVLGVSVTVLRWLGFAIHVAIAALGGRLAGRVAGRRYSFIAAGLTMVWLSPLGVAPFAYLAGLALLLGAIELATLAATRHSRAGWAACGALVALSTWMRHDLPAYFAVLVTLGLAFAAWRGGTWRDPAWRSALGWTLAGAAAVAAVTWLPLFVRVGVMPIVHDLYLDQVRYTMPARVLPFPHLFPQFLELHHPAAVVISLSGPFVGALLLWQTWRSARLLTGLVTAAALAVLPQMLGRSDVVHVLYTVPPALILACAWIELQPIGGSRSARVAQLVGAVVLALLVRPAYRGLVPRSIGPTWNPLAARGESYPMPRARGAVDGDAGIVRARMAVLEALNRVSPPAGGAPIYVGLVDHRKPFLSEMDLYFLYDRTGSTRVMQFDPNVVNRLDVQHTMVDEIERAGTRALVLSKRFTDVREPNDSAKPGATLLDETIRARFRKEMAAGPYELWVKKD